MKDEPVIVCLDCAKNFELLQADSVLIQIGCRSTGTVYACPKCRRLHDFAGDSIQRRDGVPAYLIDGHVVHQPVKDGRAP